MRYMPSFLAFSNEEKMSRPREYSERKAPRQVSVAVDRLTRFIVAITGGIFLVVPMIIMTLHQSKTKSLITVSVCIFFFCANYGSWRAGVECGDVGLYCHICCGLDGIPWGEQLNNRSARNYGNHGKRWAPRIREAKQLV